MDCESITPQNELERILLDESAEPKALPLSLLEHITNSFSDNREIGYGGFARVYKGMLDNGMVVAVKKLLNTVDIDENKFIGEVSCLMKAKQKNIVRFLGYCSDTQGEMLHCEGKLVLAEVRQRLLCFEYLPKGSLDKQITDASCGLEWSKRYKIITGICDGLYYLHQKRILHLDLKPANILLDDNMMPKIADFGLSRCFDDEQSRVITSKLTGTLGYLAPEFIRERQITFKSDIYSLGIIIIEMLTGEKGYPNVDNVLERWRRKLDKTQGSTQLVQVQVCTEIGIECTDFDPVKRPDTQHIVHRLGATKSVCESATETGASSSSLLAQAMDRSEGQINSLVGSINTLSNLEHLDWSKKVEICKPESMRNLRKIHTLNISGCGNLNKLPDSSLDMVNLKVRNMNRCVTLDASELSRLPFASLTHFVVHASSDNCSSNINLLQPTNPDKLTIDRLENVKSTEEAQSTKLIEKGKIGELSFKWTVAAWRFVDDKEVLEKLVPPSSVKNLSIVGYRSVSVPDWLMGIRHYLPNILKIYLCDFLKCNDLPLLGQLPNLKMLSLCRMEGLEEWNTADTSGKEGANEFMFPKLEMLRITECPKLRIRPYLPRAMSFSVADCDNVLSSWGEGSSQSGASSSSPITDLYVVESKVPLHQWKLLHQLPALRFLTIRRCSDLSISFGIILPLSSLESLTLQQAYEAEHPRMTSLPHWLGELISLKRLVIKDCEGIMSLPSSIQQLTKLEYLHIDGCPTLMKWCELEENKVKLAHIRDVFLRSGGSRVNKKRKMPVNIEVTIDQTNTKDASDSSAASIHGTTVSYPRLANKHEEDIENTCVETMNKLDAASGSRVENNGKKPMLTKENIQLINMKDVGASSAASIHGILTDEVHPDLYSAVMYMTGFAEEALLVALSHLMDNNAQGSAYMGMHEEQRVLWLVNFLKKYY